MRIGLVLGLHGRVQGEPPAPTWADIRAQAEAAEQAGFDTLVMEDALLFPSPRGAVGYWEAIAVAGAVAAVTRRIHFGHSVLNSPYRTPALTAKIAVTLDEISGGRYIFGIGAGNTPDDYEPFGFPTDHRYSRFAEGIQIIHSLIKTGKADFTGTFHSAKQADLVMRGPRPGGPPIVIAAGGPKMLRLAARYADEWNWWVASQEGVDQLAGLVTELERACEEEGRDPASLRRSLDVYSVDPLGRGEGRVGLGVSGSPEEIAQRLLELGQFGIDEVRCDLSPPAEPAAKVEAMAAMAEVVAKVHAG